MPKKTKKQKKQDSGAALIATLVAGGLGVLVGLFALGRGSRTGASGEAGAIDRALGLPSGAAADGGDARADTGQPSARAGEHFRPDPTASVPAGDREAFAPATLPNPNSTEPAM